MYVLVGRFEYNPYSNFMFGGAFLKGDTNTISFKFAKERPTRSGRQTHGRATVRRSSIQFFPNTYIPPPDWGCKSTRHHLPTRSVSAVAPPLCTGPPPLPPLLIGASCYDSLCPVGKFSFSSATFSTIATAPPICARTSLRARLSKPPLLAPPMCTVPPPPPCVGAPYFGALPHLLIVAGHVLSRRNRSDCNIIRISTTLQAPHQRAQLNHSVLISVILGGPPRRCMPGSCRRRP